MNSKIYHTQKGFTTLYPDSSLTMRTVEQYWAFWSWLANNRVKRMINDPFAFSRGIGYPNCTFSVIFENENNQLCLFRITPKGKIRDLVIAN